ncbi:MAG: AmmeMemoRadiSam system protein B [Candidatus Aenigmatarchaeota archaeon]
MHTRKAAVAGAFYPHNPDELRNMIKNFLERVNVKNGEVIGLLAPHAGYAYCGKTFASIYRTVANKFDTAVILGSNHSGIGAGVATCTGSWKTPLGLVDSDNDFVNELVKDSVIVDDRVPHATEHSIEVQLPWLQYLFRNFKLAPILINHSYFNTKTSEEVGSKIAQAAKKLGRKVLVIASSDLTHYGIVYGHVPFRGEPKEVIKRIKATDMDVIDSIERLDHKQVIKTCEKDRLTVCGYGAIASMIFAAKELGAIKGELVDYSTSFEVSGSLDAVVGYAGVAIY